MLRIRIVSTAAATAIIVALAQGGAAAQTASADQPGRPLSLLQPGKQTSATTPAARANTSATVAKKNRIKKVASKKHDKIAAQDPDVPADSAQTTASADAWLAASATSANPPPATPFTDTAPAAPDDRALPSAVVVDGQTVQVAAADKVNEIDLAADNSSSVTQPVAQTMMQPATQPTTQTTESTAPPGDRTDVIAAADAMAKAASHAEYVAPAPAAAGQNASDQNASAAQNANAQDVSAVGSASWIAQVLAALGGAIAAGTVAWFLIGAGPARTYG
jgi:hypothetical protein